MERSQFTPQSLSDEHSKSNLHYKVFRIVIKSLSEDTFDPTFGSPTDEVPLKSPKNRAGIGQKKVNLINGIIVSVNNTLTTLNKTLNSQ